MKNEESRITLQVSPSFDPEELATLVALLI